MGQERGGRVWAREKGVECGARERKRGECEVMLGERGSSVGREGECGEREGQNLEIEREGESVWGRVCGE